MIFEKQIRTWIEQNKLKKEALHADQIKTLIQKSEKDIKVAKLNCFQRVIEPQVLNNIKLLLNFVSIL